MNDSSRRMGVVVNPHAGGNFDGRADRLAAIVGDANDVYAPNTLDELDRCAVQMRERGVDVVAVCGGDGSFFRTLTAIGRAWGDSPMPTFLPLRGGSMNTIAQGFRCARISPEVCLAAAVDGQRAGRAGRSVERALIRVNGDLLGFMTGAGTVVSFLQAYYEGPRKGPIGAAHLMARLAWSAAFRTALIPRVFRWIPARVRCSGGELPFREYSVLYAANIADIGIGFRPTYRAGERNDAFHFVAGPVTAREFLRTLPRIRMGRPTGLSTMYDTLADRVEIEFEGPAPFMVDGDILDPVPALTLQAGPVLRVIVDPR